jgi:hypothetical protein
MRFHEQLRRFPSAGEDAHWQLERLFGVGL